MVPELRRRRPKKGPERIAAAGPGTSGAYRKVDINTRLHPAPSSPSAPRRSVRLRTHIKKSPERDCRFPGQGLRVSIREAIYTRFDRSEERRVGKGWRTELWR